jgi:uncharacterized protein (TIGR02145 family)
MKKVFLILLLTFYSLSGFAQVTGTFKDPRDGKAYKTVKIGTQTWFAENLAYKPTNGVYTIYNNDSTNFAIYGYLYDWETSKIVAPNGWHLPSKKDWDDLFNYFGGDTEKVFKALINNGSSGFNAKFGGYFGDKFANLDKFAYFWSSTENKLPDVWFIFLSSITNKASVNSTIGIAKFSVRLIKDK